MRTPALTTSLLYYIKGHSTVKQEKRIKDPILGRNETVLFAFAEDTFTYGKKNSWEDAKSQRE